jgi:hypothetical protein
MKNDCDRELIVYTIEALENLGLDGFHWGKRDEEFRKSQEELENSIDKVLVCLEWLDEHLTYFTYFANDYCYASKVKDIIENHREEQIPLGCVITAILYNSQKLEYEKEYGSKDLIFRHPSTVRDKLESRKRRIYEL